MKSFQAIIWIIFIVFYIFSSVATISAVGTLVKYNYIKKVKYFILIYSVLIVVTLIALYIWPGNIRTTRSYSAYFLINTLFLADIIFKTPLSLSFIISKLLKSHYKRNVTVIIGLIFSMTGFITILYGVLLESHRVKTEYINLYCSNLPAAFDNYKIVQISDIHAGSLNCDGKLLNRTGDIIQTIKPDLLLFTGDLVNNYYNELSNCKHVFKRIIVPGRSYSILGNHDYGNYSKWSDKHEKEKNFKALLKAHQELGFRLLRNENTIIYNDNDSVFLVGVENWGHPPFPQYADLKRALKGVPDNAFKILMTHDPAHWQMQVAGKHNIDLTLSGHTHGYQFGITIAGIPFSPAYLSRKQWGGLYGTIDNYLYVNTGLGSVGIPVRIDMPPEITVITLKRIKVN